MNEPRPDPGSASITALRRTRWPLFLSFSTLVLSQAGRLLGALVLARTLGPDGRGVVAAALLWPGVLIGLGALGLAEATTFHLATPGRGSHGVVATALATSTTVAAVLTIAGLIFVPVALSSHGSHAVHVALLALLYVPFAMIAMTLMGALNGLHRFTSFYATNAILANAQVPLIVLLAMAGRLDQQSAVIAQVASPALAAMIALVLLGGRIRDGRPQLAIARSLLGFGARVHGAAIGSLLSQRVDQIVIALFLASSDLGFYAVALSYGGMVGLPGQTITTVVLPVIARARRAQRRDLASMFIGMTLLLSVAMAIPLVLLAPVLVPRLFGSAFAPAVPLAQILAVGAISFSAAATLLGVLRADGHPGLGTIGEFLGAATKTTLFPLLMPVMGVTGAVIAATAGFSTTALWQGRTVSQHLGLDARRMIILDPRTLIAMLRRSGPPDDEPDV